MKKQTIIIMLILLPFIILIINIQLNYRAWIKKTTIESYFACRVFNKDPKGEKFCEEYAKDNSHWSPFWDIIDF